MEKAQQCYKWNGGELLTEGTLGLKPLDPQSNE